MKRSIFAALLVFVLIALNAQSGEDDALLRHLSQIQKEKNFKLVYNVDAGKGFRYRLEHLRSGGVDMLRKFNEVEGGEELSELLRLENGVIELLNVHTGVMKVSSDPIKIPELRAYFQQHPFFYLPLQLSGRDVVKGLRGEVGALPYFEPQSKLRKYHKIVLADEGKGMLRVVSTSETGDFTQTAEYLGDC